MFQLMISVRMSVSQNTKKNQAKENRLSGRFPEPLKAVSGVISDFSRPRNKASISAEACERVADDCAG